MDTFILEDQNIPVISVDTIVIGSGCAGFNAIDTLYDLGKRDIALVTEGINMGTSRNTGSDKQTYYKLTLSSDVQDSIYDLAEDLFNGGSVDGDIALVEAANSVRCFMKLVNLGVPFPTNKYGEYVGYKTDHDPRQRATSCGPLTSKLMTEKLEVSIKSKGIKIFDRFQVVKYIVKDNALTGMIAIDLNGISEDDMGLVIFNVNHAIVATGGPAGVYYNSVYPFGQTGMTGIALEAGAHAANLQEWQYGIASTKFRWNVSGTYQQVLPKYISVDKDGIEREFLLDYFETPQKALDMVFLKGYQWPFDVNKISSSSLIDIIVHHEIFDKGNRVFLDFRSDPTGLENGFEGLDEVTVNYLKSSNALVATPIKRLEIMNIKAIMLYAQNNIDLYNEMLEVSVCAQHNNGGLEVDINWESSIKGLYAVGEVAGTFGIYRPGGSALNSTQVGSMRAAGHIANKVDNQLPTSEEFVNSVRLDIEMLVNNLKSMVNKNSNFGLVKNKLNMQKRMSKNAAHIRNIDEIESMISELEIKIAKFYSESTVAKNAHIPKALKYKDILVTQLAILSAMKTSGDIMGSRGSAIVRSRQGTSVHQMIPNIRYKPDNGYRDSLIKTCFFGNKAISVIRRVRPLPRTNEWFENVWKE